MLKLLDSDSLLCIRLTKRDLCYLLLGVFGWVFFFGVEIIFQPSLELNPVAVRRREQVGSPRSLAACAAVGIARRERGEENKRLLKSR